MITSYINSLEIALRAPDSFSLGIEAYFTANEKNTDNNSQYYAAIVLSLDEYNQLKETLKDLEQGKVKKNVKSEVVLRIDEYDDDGEIIQHNLPAPKTKRPARRKRESKKE